ncbi:IclR family transcriptional regulator [Aquibacillus albus]|uniref:DNA-binding IclR family transcriptional regulator n=1 Tax=Aquibacillus albus TaxID=1168171 RepID=A0ABS2N3H7_9BACI|nr:IclR family transcriptional regulator [Aquibacillus albus]MBM7572690.1 DNA-binding IclR family transcriptional regulator [Aquibacillus albus]
MSAEKTLEILNLFDFNTRELTVPQMAEMLNQPQSSVYRNLRLLKVKGFIIESNGSYKLGYRFIKLANIVKSDISIGSIARPIMTQLTKDIGETSILLIRSEYNAVCLETIPSHQPIKVSSEQGGILPLYGGAASKIILAHMEEKFVDELFEKGLVKKHTENTIVDPILLKKNLKEIREKGYCISDSEIDYGVVSLGVPIRDMENKVIASLSIAGPRDRVLNMDKEKIISKLNNAVKEVNKFI